MEFSVDCFCSFSYSIFFLSSSFPPLISFAPSDRSLRIAIHEYLPYASFVFSLFSYHLISRGLPYFLSLGETEREEEAKRVRRRGRERGWERIFSFLFSRRNFRFTSLNFEIFEFSDIIEIRGIPFNTWAQVYESCYSNNINYHWQYSICLE